MRIPIGFANAVSVALHRAAETISPNITPTKVEQHGTASGSPGALRSLSPIFDESEHSGYVDVLITELTKNGDVAPRNIALTGHYGSGKSSVLVETQKRLAKRGVNVVNLSLPSLGLGDEQLGLSGEPGMDRTNLIQKEIVKQLLYRRKPADTPASRYNRLDTFDETSARWRGAIAGFAATVGALLVGLPGEIDDAVPAAAWTWLDNHTFDNFSVIIQWLSLAASFVLAMMLSISLQRLLQQRLRITELGADAGPASVKLSEPTASYFDEYLDEIVYYFQTSNTSVVFFEDLDRFREPHIFETLRELNSLLNNAEQTGHEPVRFLYAIRDSIFEQLDSGRTAPDAKIEAAESNGTPKTAAKLVEIRRLATTNRTKFFDLVVPMVPFISHRTSRDLMMGELKLIPQGERPGAEVVDLVSVHLTDMRLIKNICNEFDMFRTRILREEGLKELTSDNLFASIVYKNMFLTDYEKIRYGTSLLDDLYHAFRVWVTQNVSVYRRDERMARLALARKDSVKSRSKRLGERLLEVLRARSSADYSTLQVSSAGRSFTSEELDKSEFWSFYIENSSDLSVSYHDSYYVRDSVNLKFEDIQTLLGEQINHSQWVQSDRDAVMNSIHSAADKQLQFSHASLADA